MNVKRYIAASVALFVFIFLYELFVHGYLLMGFYQQTVHVWRSFEQMATEMPLAMGYQLALSTWTAFVFAQLFPSGGVENGIRFGLYFGVFAGILTASWYLWLPVPLALSWSWLASGVVEGLGGGLILGAIYRAQD